MRDCTAKIVGGLPKKLLGLVGYTIPRPWCPGGAKFDSRFIPPDIAQSA